MDPQNPAGFNVQNVHDFVQDRQKRTLETAAVAAAAYTAYRIQENQTRQIELQEQILQQQRITNLLAQGYTMGQIEQLFAAEHAAAAAADAAQWAHNWALARAAVPWVLIVLGASSLWTITHGNDSTSSGHPGAYEWVTLIVGVLCLAWKALKGYARLGQAPSGTGQDPGGAAEPVKPDPTTPSATAHQDWLEQWRQDQARRVRGSKA